MQKSTKAIKSSNPKVAAINKNFIIRWRKHGEKKWKLVSAGKYHTVVQEETLERHFEKVMDGTQQNYTFKIREQLEIVFVAK